MTSAHPFLTTIGSALLVEHKLFGIEQSPEAVLEGNLTIFLLSDVSKHPALLTRRRVTAEGYEVKILDDLRVQRVLWKLFGLIH
jgi:hypothetical protein